MVIRVLGDDEPIRPRDMWRFVRNGDEGLLLPIEESTMVGCTPTEKRREYGPAARWPIEWVREES